MISGIAPSDAIVSNLPAKLVERLWQDATLIKASSGKTILALGSTSTSVYLVLQGRVQVSLHSLAGREVILRDLGESDLFGELSAIDGQPRSASIVALTDCALAAVGAEAFRSAAIGEPATALWLARRLTERIRDLTDRVFELNALRVSSRLHCELLRMCEATAPRGCELVLDPAPTHAELAARVGTHREAITREMRFLGRRGIVIQERRRIRITDPRALEHLVELVTGERAQQAED